MSIGKYIFLRSGAGSGIGTQFSSDEESMRLSNAPSEVGSVDEEEQDGNEMGKTPGSRFVRRDGGDDEDEESSEADDKTPIIDAKISKSDPLITKQANEKNQNQDFKTPQRKQN